MNQPPRNYKMDTANRTYMNRISETPLLTVAQEVALAKRIKKGDEEARQLMIRANLRLVAKIAYDYVNLGLPMDDLIAEGNIGLTKAVDRFDPAKGGKLSTYASWWIKQTIRRALSTQCRTIQLPVHFHEKISKMRRIADGLGEELGRDPSSEEISEITGIDRRKINSIKEAAYTPMSLDAPLGQTPDERNTLADLVADEAISKPDTLLCQEDLLETLQPLLEELNERERSIIQQRFGLGGVQRKTLSEVGEDFGLTRERIRQVQNIALSKLRRALARLENPGHRALFSPQATEKSDRLFFGPN